jgi:hypothetical protein
MTGHGWFGASVLDPEPPSAMVRYRSLLLDFRHGVGFFFRNTNLRWRYVPGYP